MLRRLLLGLTVAAGTLCVTELALRATRGPLPAPPHVRSRWDPGEEPFSVSGGLVSPTFQGRDAIRSFRGEPADGQVRIAVFGESSVRAGSQLPPAQEFPALLQQRLFTEGRSVEVLNLGRSGADSHSIRRIAGAAAAYDLDAAVLYLGHNDVGNAFFAGRYATVTTAGAAHLRAFLHRWHTYSLLRDAIVPPSSAEPDARVDDAALSAPQLAVIAADFATNLELTVRALRDSGIAVLLVTPISREGTWSTAGTGCPEAVPAERPVTWEVDEAEGAVAAAPDCADARFVRGLALQQAGRLAEGWSDLHAARDRDRRPLRATTGIVAAVREVGERTGVPVLDLAAQQEALPADESDPWFKDPVHLSREGHHQFAERIHPALVPLLP